VQELNNNSWRLKVTPPTFSGNKGEDVISWLFKYRSAMEVNNVPKRLWVQLALQFLTGNASVWFISTLGPEDLDGYDYKRFVKKIRKEYEPFENAHELRDRLDNLKQGDSINDYVKEFRLLVLQINDMAEVDKIRAFTRGLKGKTAAYTRLEQPQTIESAIHIAITHERVISKERIFENKKDTMKYKPNSSFGTKKLNDNVKGSKKVKFCANKRECVDRRC
jgi:hypothetical protein